MWVDDLGVRPGAPQPSPQDPKFGPVGEFLRFYCELIGAFISCSTESFSRAVNSIKGVFRASRMYRVTQGL